MNSKAEKINSITKEVVLQVGNWNDNCSLLCVSLGDFDLILRIDFFLKAKMGLLPHLGRMMIMDESQPCFVRATKENVIEKGQIEMVSTFWIKKGFKCGNVKYIATLVENKVYQSMEVPDGVAQILEEFKDVMLVVLPPRHNIDHNIELLPGTKPPT